MDLPESLVEMGITYRKDPIKAVRNQSFIKILHAYLRDDLMARLTPEAIKRGIEVIPEARVLGSHKPKDVDLAVVDPHNGPLMMIGVRSQMSSVGKNVLNYYEGIVGECISLQDRFPMSTYGYVYLMPLKPIKEGRETESVSHARFAKMYAAITGRSESRDYKSIRGLYDHFAYMVVDFDADPPVVRDDIVDAGVKNTDLKVSTLVDRMISTFNERLLFLNVFS